MVTRKNICSVYTERHRRSDPGAEAQPHLMMRAVPGKYLMGTGSSEVGDFDGNFSRCSGCGHEERDVHYCDYVVHYYIGNWPHTQACDKKAVHLVDKLPDSLELKFLAGRQFWVCTIHQGDKVAERKAVRNKREKDRYDADMAKRNYGWVGRGYEDLLLEVADWMCKNQDLLESDEWLKSIARKMDKNTNLGQAEEKKWGHRYIIPRGIGSEGELNGE